MTTYLILSHQPLPHIAAHAARHPQAHYYIHHDAQSPRLTGSLTTLPNVHLISHRIRINWGGFTMIEATLALIQAALANPDTLSLDDLWAAKKNGAWFARKVSAENQMRWLEYEQDV